MKFDKILDNGSLWAVRYEGDDDNALRKVFAQWNDPEWLWDFFTENMADLESYFKITDLNQAIYDTIDDSGELECLILDISPDADLDLLFRPLENSRTAEMYKYAYHSDADRIDTASFRIQTIIKTVSHLFAFVSVFVF